MIRERVAKFLFWLADRIDPPEPVVEPEPEEDETESWPVPAQQPVTAASRALEWHPEPRVKQAPAPPVLAGSAAARVQAARRAS